MRLKPILWTVALVPIFVFFLARHFIPDPDVQHWTEIGAVALTFGLLFVFRGKDGWIGEPPKAIEARWKKLNQMLMENVDWVGNPLSSETREEWVRQSEKLARKLKSARDGGFLE